MLTDIATETADVKPNARGWKYFADQINSIWRKGAADFINCGQLLLDAKAELANDAFNALIKKLAFDRSVGTKLMAIASNPILCAHVDSLPPSWGTLYELSQLKDDVLEAKLADGTINPGMERKAALALKPKRTPTPTPTSNTDKSSNTSQLSSAWDSASVAQRRAFLDEVGRAGLCGAMSDKLKAEFQNAMVIIGNASETAPFAIYATGKLHTALRCAEEPNEENIKIMVAALGRIIKKAESKKIERGRIVIAEGKARR